MSIGFQSWNENGVLQLDSTLVATPVIQSGRVTSDTPVGAETVIYHEPHGSALPLLFIRPDPGTFVGGLIQFHDQLWVTNRGGFDYMLLSLQGTPQLFGDGNVGLRLWDANGVMTYSSQWRHARIANIVPAFIPGGWYTPQPGITRQISLGTGVSGYRPWLGMQDVSYASFGGQYPSAMWAIGLSADGTQMHVQARSADTFDTGFVFDSQGSQFLARPMLVPVAAIPYT
ncbi:hypothetical protein QTH90_06235 [Variovorax sp. J2P1-59]|uniref:hypothetical protein n=1 Tax=Variovorax flavidus TaxID=3053501 RepID=UPI00257850BC|nr:hypothetical protein [Variovorax sp. J2P1-59]MDM0073972.1 hypothetical protein [Variovorax sp. J2P1-59]